MNIDSLTLTDRIFLGEGLFETIKVHQAEPCFPWLHWERLHDAAHYLGLSFTVSKDDWLILLQDKIKKEKLTNGGIKVILTGGSAPRGLVAQGKNNQLLLNGFTYSAAATPLALISASWLRDARNPIYQLKTVNYLEAIIARREAMKQGADDALFFNMDHHATEATCANLFLVYQGCLLTAPIEDGVLPGITRLRILQYCSLDAIPHAQKTITKEMLYAAEAVFLTSSLQGIQYVSSYDKHVFSTSHPLVDRLKQVFNQ